MASKKENSSVTLRDVAEACGLAKSTVSHALRDDPMIAAKTRERVHRVAAELGYRPHPAFAAIGSRRRRALNEEEVIVILREKQQAWLFDDAYYESTSRLAESLGYQTALFELGGELSDKRVGQVLLNRGFRLLLFAGGSLEAHSGFPWQSFAAVACGNHTHLPPIDLVRENAVEGVTLAWRKVWEAGWRRIGLYHPVNPDGSFSVLDERRLATFEWRQRQDSRSADWIPPLTPPSPARPESFQKWVRKHRPEAIISKGITPAGDPGNWFEGDPLPTVALHNRNHAPGLAGCPNLNPELYERALHILDQKYRSGLFSLPGSTATTVLDPRWVEGASFWGKPGAGGG